MPSASNQSIQIDREILLMLIRAARLGHSNMNDVEARSERTGDKVVANASADGATDANWAIRHAVAAIAGVDAADVTAVFQAMRDLGLVE